MTVQSRRIGALASDRLGVTVIEYAIIACLIGPVVIAAFTSMWAPLNPGFTIIGNFLTSSAAAGF
jgi:Flp pilus assembly pilin Flp